VINEGAGGDMVSQYKSIIYYHEDRPRWCETVKVRTLGGNSFDKIKIIKLCINFFIVIYLFISSAYIIKKDT